MDTSQSKRLSIRPERRENRLSFVASVKPNPGTPDSAMLTMEQSPLTQQTRPDVFEPKVVGLYRSLFRVCMFVVFGLQTSNRSKDVEDDEKSEGFWRELFLLKPDLPKLREMLENTDAEFLLHIQVSVHSAMGRRLSFPGRLPVSTWLCKL